MEFPGDPVTMSPNSDRTFYPEFTYSGDESLELPKKGKMTIEYSVTREVEEERNGKEHYSCTVQVEKILDVDGEHDIRPSRRDTSTEDALDTLARAFSKKSESESY